jgi:hypothetical protein
MRFANFHEAKLFYFPVFYVLIIFLQFCLLSAPAMNQQPPQGQQAPGAHQGPYIVPNNNAGGQPGQQDQQGQQPAAQPAAQPAVRGRPRLLGPLSRRMRQPRRPPAAQAPAPAPVAVVASLNPMHKDFSPPNGGVAGARQTKRWFQRFEMVRSRSQFRPVAVHTLAKARDGNQQVLSVQFKGNFLLEGTWPSIMEALHSKIIEATERSFEEDAAAQVAARNAILNNGGAAAQEIIIVE